MADFLLLIPTGPRVGLTTVSIGLVRAFEREGVRVGFVEAGGQPRSGRSAVGAVDGDDPRADHLMPRTPLDRASKPSARCATEMSST